MRPLNLHESGFLFQNILTIIKFFIQNPCYRLFWDPVVLYQTNSIFWQLSQNITEYSPVISLSIRFCNMFSPCCLHNRTEFQSDILLHFGLIHNKISTSDDYQPVRMQLHKGFQQIVRRGFPNYKDCAWRLVMVGFAVQVCMTLGILYRLTCHS